MRVEVAEARWLPLDEAPRLLTHGGEREMAAKAPRGSARERPLNSAPSGRTARRRPRRARDRGLPHRRRRRREHAAGEPGGIPPLDVPAARPRGRRHGHDRDDGARGASPPVLVAPVASGGFPPRGRARDGARRGRGRDVDVRLDDDVAHAPGDRARAPGAASMGAALCADRRGRDARAPRGGGRRGLQGDRAHGRHAGTRPTRARPASRLQDTADVPLPYVASAIGGVSHSRATHVRSSPPPSRGATSSGSPTRRSCRCC